MRSKIIKRIKSEWGKSRDEGLQAACHTMGWKCEQDYDYASSGPTYFAAWVNGTVYVMEQGVVGEDLDILLSLMTDDVLLDFWEAQLCLKHR